jgi:uncharacterized protein (DUF2236 family)
MARLPAPLQSRLEAMAETFLEAPGLPRVDFSRPLGAPALFAPDAVAWRVMKNPLTLVIGGIAGVILELAEPRVRTGVWEHTRFRQDPLARMKRTGRAAMATVYAPAATARALIEGVSRRHDQIKGATPAGEAFAASDPELLNWVQATASFGFVEAYRRFGRPLSKQDCDRFYAEGALAASLYGATGAPRSQIEVDALFAGMQSKLERSEIVFEFLRILGEAPILPMRQLQRLCIRAAVEITPPRVRDLLGLGQSYALGAGGGTVLSALGAAADRLALLSAPPAQACVRLGLPADYLYR